MAARLLITLLLATTALYASATYSGWDATPVSSPPCNQRTPCPKGKGTVWYCLDGKAYNGCSIGKPFPSKDCYEQCTDDGSKYGEWDATVDDDYEPTGPSPVCDYKPPCPKGKGTVWYCLSGKAYNGCSVGKPFPWADCSEQCTDDGSKKVEWTDKKEVEWASSNWETPKAQDWEPTPVPAPKPSPVCDYKPPCPKGKGTVWYCLSGKAYNGCSVGKPFPWADCSEQCTDDGSKKDEWSNKEVDWAPSSWETPVPSPKPDWTPTPVPIPSPVWTPTPVPTPSPDWTPTPAVPTPTPSPVCDYKPPCPKGKGTVWYCLSGKAYNGCSVGKPFPWVDCSEQCTDDGSKKVEWSDKKEVEWASSNWETPKAQDWEPTPVPTPKPAPVCDYQPPCPKGKGTVWYCLSGKAHNGCSVGKPFPWADCSEQCTDDGSKKVEWSDKKEVDWEASPKADDWESTPSGPAPVCDYKPPCPKGKGKVWYCLDGKAYNGCSVGQPFPSKDCYKQCTDDGSKATEWY